MKDICFKEAVSVIIKSLFLFLEIPVPELKLKNKKSDVFPKEMVQLSCMMPNSSGWTYTWYRDGGLIQADNNVVIGTNGATISFPSDPSLHQIQPYTCEAELKHRSVRSNFSSTVTLQVYGKLFFLWNTSFKLSLFLFICSYYYLNLQNGKCGITKWILKF